MAEIKLIITDLDGTFCVDTDTIPAINIEAAKAAQQKGIPVCACTGRHWPAAKPVVSAAGLDDLCAICNGAAVVEISTGKLRYRSRLHPDVLKKLVDVCVKHDLLFVGHTAHKTPYYMPALIERFRSSIEGNAPEEELAAHDPYDSPEAFVEGTKDDMLMLMVTTRQGVLPNETIMEELYACGDITVTSSESGELQIMAGESNKEAGAKVLADCKGVPAEQVLALGDNYNDVDMMVWAGTSAAMGGAKPEAKAVADYVSDTCQNGGAGKAIQKYVL